MGDVNHDIIKNLNKYIDSTLGSEDILISEPDQITMNSAMKDCLNEYQRNM